MFLKIDKRPVWKSFWIAQQGCKCELAYKTSFIQPHPLTATQKQCVQRYASLFYLIWTNEYSLHFLWTLVFLYNRHTSSIIMFQRSCTTFQHTCFRLRGDRRGTPSRYHRGGPTRRWNSKALCQPRWILLCLIHYKVQLKVQSFLPVFFQSALNLVLNNLYKVKSDLSDLIIYFRQKLCLFLLLVLFSNDSQLTTCGHSL